MLDCNVVIMAAGRGTRMKSDKPKVLHTVGGMSMLQRVVNTAGLVEPRNIVVVVGCGSELVQQSVQGNSLHFVLQEPQLGTGHAVQQALPLLPDSGVTLILNGDVPLVAADDLAGLVRECAGKSLVLLTVELDDPTGYGRIVRSDDDKVVGIVEQKDATAAQQQIKEINTGVMAVPTQHLKRWLVNLKNDNAQKEYYLTDIVAMAVSEEVRVDTRKVEDPATVAGVNSPQQLAALERAFQKRVAEDLMSQGVRLADPARLDVRGELHCGRDVEIDVGCVFSGKVRLGNNVRIGAHCVISNAVLADDVEIHPFTHIDGGKQGVEVGAGSLVGPYARLRPGATLGEQVHVGNFVEVKNSTLAHGAKANHLTYLGDATVGEQVNVGAGTITANYDGVNKYRTTIGAYSRIGSNTVLVAPVEIGERSTIAAGSAITQNAPADTLTLARARQISVPGWKRPEKPVSKK
ncbi:Bifunctional protein GlmU [Saezia sanguinis]|uniref:Bifunctional protein GlmU n=1 Tax=Saezia sanguinis TaxID=1965230 RepID=A0A433SCB8_9BURK|nr:bifunctional UDP-N-acetylglucosamine diphosphorylase/glucosamine-1-phosphate N-acetyltransferase GlmU [Saezia sanguinis]RUS66369.1 Bifunctional protein GlmU [Saezia sanguinis]